MRSVWHSQVYGKAARYKLKDGVYRCRKCWDKLRKNKTLNPNSGNTLIVNCSCCDKPRKFTFSAVKRLADPYHCRDCYLKLRKAKVIVQATRNDVKIICPDCGKEKMVKKSLSEKLSGLCLSCKNKGERNPSWKGGNVALECMSCGNKKSVRRNRVQDYKRSNGDYFCKSCAYKNKPSGPDNHAWRGGISFEPYPVTWTPGLRREIRERDDHTCQLCRTKQSSRKMPVHHIDYCKENNDPKNLITLCGKCHPKTNYKREYWTSFFNELMAQKHKEAA